MIALVFTSMHGDYGEVEVSISFLFPSATRRSDAEATIPSVWTLSI